MTTPKNDPGNRPAHYTSDPSGVECITITRHRNFNIGNAIKYLWRAGLKSGDTNIQDLKKAVWYIQDEIGRLDSTEKQFELALNKDSFKEINIGAPPATPPATPPTPPSLTNGYCCDKCNARLHGPLWMSEYVTPEGDRQHFCQACQTLMKINSLNPV